MEKELIEFIESNNLNPFNSPKTPVKIKGESIFKTKDSKSVYTKVLSKISNNFCFADTSNLLNVFAPTQDISTIKKRQDFFKSIKKSNNCFLKDLKKPRPFWKPEYDIVVITEDESTFEQLQNLGCPVQFIVSERDLEGLESCDIVQVIECNTYSRILESLPQTVFLNSLDEVYLERYLEKISGWKENIELLEKNESNEEIKCIVSELIPLVKLFDKQKKEKITRENVEESVEKINDEVSEKMKNLTVSGVELVSMFSKGQLPNDIQKIIDEEIKASGIPSEVFHLGVPISIDEKELENLMKRQSTSEFTSFSEELTRYASKLVVSVEKLKKLENLILMFDFTAGISKFIEGLNNYPTLSEDFDIENSKNIFLENPEAITFHLKDSKCSILTGANSGGKTTLIEHVIQLVSLFQIGLPVTGNVKMPLFSDVYYFAKNKGSSSKGAFETLLSQMSQIKPGDKTVVLADEIESVTEPGVAGIILNATAKYFIDKGCFLIIATHLGQEIQKNLPKGTRIDGIEAKGLDEHFELIVNHNPILGKLARSTPELIIEKLAGSKKEDYFVYLHDYLKDFKLKEK